MDDRDFAYPEKMTLYPGDVISGDGISDVDCSKGFQNSLYSMLNNLCTTNFLMNKCPYDQCCSNNDPDHVLKYKHPLRDDLYPVSPSFTVPGCIPLCKHDQYCSDESIFHQKNFQHPQRDFKSLKGSCSMCPTDEHCTNSEENHCMKYQHPRREVKTRELCQMFNIFTDRPEVLRMFSHFSILSQSIPRMLNLFNINIPIDFLSRFEADYTLTSAPQGMGITFGIVGKFSRTVFLNKSLDEGVIRCTMEVAYKERNKYDKRSYLYIGVAAVDSSLDIFEDGKQSLGRTVGCSFNFWRRKNGNLASNLRGVHMGGSSLNEDAIQVPNGALVTLEVDAINKTLSFFVNDTKIPVAISQIPVPFHVGIGGSNASCTVLSLSRAHRTTPSLVPRFYPSRIIFDYIRRDQEGYTFTDTADGLRCTFGFSQAGSRTVFLKQALDRGIFQWTVKVGYCNELTRKSYLHFGCASRDDLNKFIDGRKPALGKYNGCSLNFWQDDAGRTYSILRGVQNVAAQNKEQTPVPDSALVTLLADLNSRTLTYFVNGIRMPVAISKIPVPLHLGISGSHSSFTLVSLGPLTNSTPSTQPCKFYQAYAFFDCIQKAQKGYTVTDTAEGVMYTFGFSQPGTRTVFLDKPLSQGIYQWTVRVVFCNTPTKKSYLHFGATAIEDQSKFDDGRTTALGKNNGCSLNFWQDDDGKTHSLLRGVQNGPNDKTETPVPDGALVTLEANMDTRTICFFVNEKKVLMAISQIPKSIYLGMSGSHSSFTVISHGYAPHATYSSIPIKYYSYV